MILFTPLQRLGALGFGLGFALALGACASPSAPTDSAPSPERTSQVAMTAPPGAAAKGAPTATAAPALIGDAGPFVDAGGGAASLTTPPALASSDAGSDAQAAAGGEEAQPYAADNKIKPPEGRTEELQTRAKGLFEAIVKNEPALGDPFWFPKEPFIPLKDVKGPEKYWKNLHQAYAEDIRKAHRKRKSWAGATFIGFDIGSTPKWVKPGDEVNKIGYYRSFHGKLRYEMDGEKYSIDVHTVISWQGRWYVTHLGKFK